MVTPAEVGCSDTGKEQVVKLVRGEVGAILQAGVCLKSVSGDGGGIGGGDVSEQGDDIKAHHDIVGLEGDVL